LIGYCGSPPGLRIIVVRASRLPKMSWLNQAGETPAPQTWRRAVEAAGLSLVGGFSSPRTVAFSSPKAAKIARPMKEIRIKRPSCSAVRCTLRLRKENGERKDREKVVTMNLGYIHSMERLWRWVISLIGLDRKAAY